MQNKQENKVSAAFSDAINLRANILDGCQMPKREQEVLGGGLASCTMVLVGPTTSCSGGYCCRGGGMFVVLWA